MFEYVVKLTEMYKYGNIELGKQLVQKPLLELDKRHKKDIQPKILQNTNNESITYMKKIGNLTIK
jgi:hypothetical protein